LAATFAVLARDLARHQTRADTLTAIVGPVRSLIPGAEHAGLTFPQPDGSMKTVAATSDWPQQVDARQYSANEGPCVDAIREHHIFLTNDLRTDPRWPKFAPAAVEETGVLSILSHRLFLDDELSLGGLNLYSSKPDAFDDDSIRMLSLYATHAAIAYALVDGQQRANQLETALRSNRDIGMAMGVLMALHKVTKEEAFDLLRIASQRGHRKLASVALDVIETGTLELPK
jgi:GAF domain-containing protein